MMINNNIVFKIKIILVILVALSVASLYFFIDFAKPDFPQAFLIKRVKEKLIMMTKRSPVERLDYNLSLLDKRLEELNYIVVTEKFSCVVHCALRYSTTAGKVVRLMKENNLHAKKEYIADKFKDHKQRLSKIIESYPVSKSDEWRYIVDSINYLNIYAEQLTEE